MRLSDIEFDDNDTMIWTWPLTLLVCGAGVLLSAVCAVLWQFFPGRDPVIVVGVVGSLCLLVGLAGRAGSVLEARYGDMPLAQPPTAADPAHHTGARRRSARRASGVAYVFAGLGLLLVVIALPDREQDPPAVAVFLAGGLALALGSLLVGPAAGFVVTPTHLHVDTAFRRISVPRRLLGEFQHSGFDIRLRLTDGDFLDIRVDTPILDVNGEHRTNARCRVRTARRIATMLRDVPARPDPATGGVTHRLRHGTLAIEAVALLAVLATAGIVFF